MHFPFQPSLLNNIVLPLANTSSVLSPDVINHLDFTDNFYPKSFQQVWFRVSHPPRNNFPGLIDEGETPEQAAFRELEEETGFKATKVVDSSPTIVSDPGWIQSSLSNCPSLDRTPSTQE
jgi:hypothetical protein